MSAPEARVGGYRPMIVALVNNMPDSAFVDTEEQFRRAVEDALDAQVNVLATIGISAAVFSSP